MASRRKVRVGIVGVNPERGFAAVAHIPALKSLPDVEIVAVCTRHQDSANAAARHFGVPLAFADPAELVRHPDVDLVTVTVKAPHHFKPVMAAVEAAKHVYCEWPLGQTTEEAVRMADAARRAGVRHAVGLQGQVMPEFLYLKDLVADGYVGRPLSVTWIGSRGERPSGGRSEQPNFAIGANMLTVTGGHQIDALCHALGEFRELSAMVTGNAKTGPEQVVVNGIVESGAVVSVHIRSGMSRGTGFLMELHGDRGDLVLRSTTRDSLQRQPLKLAGAQDKAPLAELPIPARYRWVPEVTPKDSPYNVAQLYAGLTDAIDGGSRSYPDFDAGVRRHRLMDMIVRASETGEKQTA